MCFWLLVLMAIIKTSYKSPVSFTVSHQDPQLFSVPRTVGNQVDINWFEVNVGAGNAMSNVLLTPPSFPMCTGSRLPTSLDSINSAQQMRSWFHLLNLNDTDSVRSHKTENWTDCFLSEFLVSWFYSGSSTWWTLNWFNFPVQRISQSFHNIFK